MKNSQWRGNNIRYKEQEGVWVYTDTGENVSDNPERRCGYCNLGNRDDDCDPCLGKLPGVINACCGHGDRECSYIQFSNGLIVRGFTVEK